MHKAAATSTLVLSVWEASQLSCLCLGPVLSCGPSRAALQTGRRLLSHSWWGSWNDEQLPHPIVVHWALRRLHSRRIQCVRKLHGNSGFMCPAFPGTRACPCMSVCGGLTGRRSGAGLPSVGYLPSRCLPTGGDLCSPCSLIRSSGLFISKININSC